MRIREFRPGDEAGLHAVFLSAIHDIASADYSREQIEAWAPASMDQDIWTERMRGIRPFVAQVEGSAIGYADVQANGYIDHFFVAGPWARRGVGTQLMNRICEIALMQNIPVLTSDVSKTAQAFFSQFGFVIVEERAPMIRGVVVPNALMRCEVTSCKSPFHSELKP